MGLLSNNEKALLVYQQNKPAPGAFAATTTPTRAAKLWQMDVIEFLQRTDLRNLQYNVGFLVQQKMKQRELELAQRRGLLRDILECENLNYDEELLLLFKERVKASEQKRLDWIGGMRLERERAEQELLRLKTMQQELENCESWRELESRQILLETKRAQLCQIEEKQALKRREADIERLWHEAHMRLQAEQQRQQAYEQKLQKVIASVQQAENTRQDEQLKTRQREEAHCLRQTYAAEDARAVDIDKKYREAALEREWHKRQQQSVNLQEQIRENRCNLQTRQLMGKHEALQLKMTEDAQMIRHLNEKIGKRIRNREWHKCFLAHAEQQRQQSMAKQLELDEAFLGTGCVLQQQRKSPYGKFSR